MKTHARKCNNRDTYLELVKQFPLVSIQTEEQLADAQKFVDQLLKKEPLDSGEEEYLDALSDLIGVYEDAHYHFPSVSAAALLSHLMEAKNVSQADVSRGTEIARSIISEILKGKRRFAMPHIGRLSRFFKVPASVFITDDCLEG